MKNRTILIVEDDKGIRDGIAGLLELEGFTVLQAEQGEEALALLEANLEPMLVILDVMMPVMSGEKFLLELRGNSLLRNTPVIVISAARPDYLATLPHQCMLSKPFEMDDLLCAIRRLSEEAA